MAERKPRRSAVTTPQQPELFGGVVQRANEIQAPRRKRTKDEDEAPAKWKMPEQDGSTVAEVRLRWRKRLTPAQVARVQAEIGTLPKLLEKLGFGPVLVERSFVRRRKSD